MANQPRPSKGGWTAALFIIFVEVAERFAFYGLSTNLITYLTVDLHQPLATAAKNVNTWVGVSNIFPVIGGVIADSYYGRFKTVVLSTTIYLVGTVLLTLSVSVVPLHQREAAFFVALYIMAVGEGGHMPCVQTFAADQFDDENAEEKESKSSFFNYWYLAVVASASAAVLVFLLIQGKVGYTAAFGMLAGAVAVGLLLFLLGIKKYRKQAPLGSPFTAVARVIVAAFRKQRVSETGHGHGIYYGDSAMEGQHCRGPNLVRTNEYRLLDKAMIIDSIDASSKTRNPWRLCTLNQVEEVKLVLRLIPVWLSCLMFTVVLSQTHTFYVKQASTMIRSLGPNFQVPAASLQAIVGIIIIVTVLTYDRVFVPLARKATGHPTGITVLQRIGIGLFLCILQMVVAALIEAKRVSIARDHGLLDNPKEVVPMRLWWLLPQYIISGVADAFTIVGLQELFYTQVPEAMRSVGAAAYVSALGIGSFINTAIITVVQAVTSRNGSVWLGNNINRAHIDYYYWVLAVMSGVNLCVYAWITRSFVYKKLDSEETLEMIELSNFDGGVNAKV